MFLYAFRHAPHGAAAFVGHASAAPTDHWLNLATGSGGVAAVIGLVAGGFFTARYGRRASLSLSATATKRPDGGYVIAARPKIKAVGVFRVRLLKGNAGSTVMVAEVSNDEQGRLKKGTIYPATGFMGESFVEGGEVLATTALVSVPAPDSATTGWAVWVQLCVPNRFLRLGRVERWVDHLFPRQRWSGRVARWIIRKLPTRFSNRIRRLLRSPGSAWTDQVFVPVPRGEGQG